MSPSLTGTLETTEVTCTGCHTTSEIPTVHAAAWAGICPSCIAQRSAAFDLQRSVETFDSLNDQHTLDVHPVELMRLADDGAPAADIVDSWTNDDFPQSNTAATDVAPTETRNDGARVAEVGSRKGSRDADEHGTSFDGNAVNAAEEEVGTHSASHAGRPSNSSLGFLSSRGDGAAHQAALSSSFIVVGGDLTARLAPIASDNLSPASVRAVRDHFLKFFGRLAS